MYLCAHTHAHNTTFETDENSTNNISKGTPGRRERERERERERKKESTGERGIKRERERKGTRAREREREREKSYLDDVQDKSSSFCICLLYKSVPDDPTSTRWQCVAVCCSVLQCVALCCSVN